MRSRKLSSLSAGEGQEGEGATKPKVPHLLTLLLFFLPIAISAQSPPPGQISLLATSVGDTVLLRWAPTDLRTWEQLIADGVYVDRYTVARDGLQLPLAERSQRLRLTTLPLRPRPEAEFGRVATAGDRYVAIGGQSIYGDNFTVIGDDENGQGLANSAQSETNRYGFGLFAADQSWIAAEMMALGYADGEVNENETYVYRIVPAVPLPRLDITLYGFATVRVKDTGGPPKITGVVADFKDRVADVGFDISNSGSHYSGYVVQRSGDGVTYQKLNELPFVPLRKETARDLAIYQDSFPANNRPYFYRVAGITPFGRLGPWSDPAQGMGKDPLPPSRPSIASILETQEGGMQLTWAFPNELEDQLDGFRVRRAPSDQAEYIPVSELLPPATREFTDPAPLASNYYTVTAYDAYGRPLSSVTRLAMPDDTIPPAIPKNIRGVITKEGDVVVTWDPNEEPDLLGYRLFFANQPEAEYTLGSNHPEELNFYRGRTTLNTLTSKLYVKLVSLDLRYNTSELSNYVTLLRPDTIPPAPPLITDFMAGTEELTLNWANSESSDLSRHELYRRPAGDPDSEWKMIGSYPLPDSLNVVSFLDTEARPGQMQEYRVDAIDYSNLRSVSNIMAAEILDDFIRKPLGKVEGRPDRTDRSIELSWAYEPEEGDFGRFEIFRLDADGDAITLAIVDADAIRTETGTRRKRKTGFSFIDRGPLRMETNYTYQIRALYDDGGKSPLSELVTVAY